MISALSNLPVKVVELLNQAFPSSDSSDAPDLYFSPARINLIGEYVDFCGGQVLPATVQFGTYFAARRNTDGVVRVASLNQPGLVEFNPNEALERSVPVEWGDYVKGVFSEYAKLGVEMPGVDIAIAGDIPGGGLSSSASLEVGVALLIESVTGYRASSDRFANRQAMSRLAQRAENLFVGVNCGIMDQGAIALGKADHAMLINSEDLSVEYFRVRLGDCCLLIGDTGKDRKLEESSYNERREQVETAQRVLSPIFNIEYLCEVPFERLNEALMYLEDPVVRRRARHVITEQQRVQEATESLAQGDTNRFGRLLNDSHQSLQNDFEVTGRELDALVGLSQAHPSVVGSRMMGAGFGGCSLVLALEAAVDEIAETVTRRYRDRIGLEAKFYRASIGPGAARIAAGDHE